MAHARGDRVRLMPALAKRLIEDKEKRNRGGLKRDWRERRGVVISSMRSTRWRRLRRSILRCST